MHYLLGERSVSWLRTLLFSGDRKKATWAIVGFSVGLALVGGALLVFFTPVGGLAVILAGLCALLMLRDVRWGLVALAAVIGLLPFASLPIKLGFTPTFLDLVLGALYAVWGIRLATRQQHDFILTPIGVPVLVFIALALFSFVMGLAHSRPSANDARTFCEVLLGFGIFFLVVNNVRDQALLRQLTASLVLVGAAESGVGILFYVLPKTWTVRLLSPLGRLGYPVGLEALRYINDDSTRPMRAIGTNVDPNILGALLVVVLCLAGVQLVARRPVLPRGVLALSVGLMGICLFLTYSRSSMFGVVVALGVIALLRYRRLFLLLMAAGLLLLLLPQTQAYVANFVQGIEIADRSTQMRMGEYKDTFELIRRYPWIGVGFVGTPDIDLYLGVASLYLTLAAQMGIIGLLSFCAVAAAFMITTLRAWRTSRMNPSVEPLLLGYLAAVLGSLVSGLLDHTLLTYPHAVALLWLTLGMGIATARIATLARESQSSVDKTHADAVTALLPARPALCCHTEGSALCSVPPPSANRQCNEDRDSGQPGPSSVLRSSGGEGYHFPASSRALIASLTFSSIWRQTSLYTFSSRACRK